MIINILIKFRESGSMFLSKLEFAAINTNFKLDLDIIMINFLK